MDKTTRITIQLFALRYIETMTTHYNCNTAIDGPTKCKDYAKNAAKIFKVGFKPAVNNSSVLKLLIRRLDSFKSLDAEHNPDTYHLYTPKANNLMKLALKHINKIRDRESLNPITMQEVLDNDNTWV